MKASELYRKCPKTPDFDHSNYRLFEMIPAVPGTSNNRGLTVYDSITMQISSHCRATFPNNIGHGYVFQLGV